MNFSLDSLTFTQLIIVIFVAIELVVVAVALVAMIWVRARAIQREQVYANARRDLLHCVQMMTGIHPNPAAKPRAVTILSSLTRDHARRLLTEMAEEAGREGAIPFEELYGAVNLGAEARANANARPWERLRAIREARALSDPARLLKGLSLDQVPDVRLGAFEALCSLGRADEAVAGLPLLADDGRLNRMRAIDALVASTPLPQAAMIELARSQSTAIRQIVVAVLGMARVREGVEVVIHAVTDVDAEVRIQAVKALREMRDASALAVVLSALDDERWEVRSEATRTAAVLGGGGAAEKIALRLDDSAEWVRHNAAIALSQCGPQGLSCLRAAAAKGNHGASNALAEARLKVADAAAAPA